MFKCETSLGLRPTWKLNIRHWTLDILLVFFLTLPFLSHAQDQMVFLRHDQVIARFSTGDYVQVKLKNKTKIEGRIIEFTEFSMITSFDTVSVTKILHIKSKHQKRSFNRGIGGLLFIGGIVYMSVELLNATFGYNGGVDPNVAKTSALLSSAGLVWILLHPRYTKVKPGTTIRVIDYKSRFYR